MNQFTFSATYSPEDRKRRPYADLKLDAVSYTRATEVGFDWRDLMKSVGHTVPAKKPARALILNFQTNEHAAPNAKHVGADQRFRLAELSKSDCSKIYREQRGRLPVFAKLSVPGSEQSNPAEGCRNGTVANL